MTVTGENRMMRALLAATAAGFLGSSALAQSGDPIVTISVEADRDHTRAHVIEIIAASARPARSQGRGPGPSLVCDAHVR